MRCKGDYTYYLLNGLRIDVIVVVIVDVIVILNVVVNVRPTYFFAAFFSSSHPKIVSSLSARGVLKKNDAT